VPYWRLHDHFVWTTFERTPWLDDGLSQRAYRSMRARAARLGAFVHAIGGTADHVHVVVSVPPTLAVAACIGQLKGASSHSVNETSGTGAAFRWQSGYGALSLGERSLPAAIAYVRRQREHHAAGSVLAGYEMTTEGTTDPTCNTRSRDVAPR
jgi:putative transposase